MAGECPICFGDLGAEAAESLACGHTFHVECVNETLRCRGISNKLDLKCPSCRLTGTQCLSLSQAELAQQSAGTAPSSSNAGLQPAVLMPPSQAIPSTPVSQMSESGHFPAIGQAAEDSQAAPSTPAEASQAAPTTPALQIVPSSQVEAASQVASPERLTQGGNSVPLFEDETWGFSFQDLSRQAGDPAMQDPIPAILDRVKNAATWSSFRREVHPPDLFDGLQTAKQIRKSVYERIQVILQRGHSHRQLAADCGQFSLRLLAPIPHKKAVDAICLRQGWSREGLWQGFLVNMGWLEHHASRAVSEPGDVHGRALPIAAFFGGPPSLRKSSLKKFVCSQLFQTASMPQVLSMGLAVSGEATVKGQSACLIEHGRGGLENDEVSKVYSTSFSAGDAGRGLHHATKPKILTLVNGEADVVATGHGQVKIEAGSRL